MLILVFGLTGFFSFGLSSSPLHSDSYWERGQCLSIKSFCAIRQGGSNIYRTNIFVTNLRCASAHRTFLTKQHWEKEANISVNDSTSKALKNKENKNARRATIMSACVPGLGQIYNRQYWKVPIIYGAFVGLGYLYKQNNVEYLKYKNALLYRYDTIKGNDTTLSKYTEANLITLKDQYKKYNDLSLIGLGVIYVLNIVDATVGAHLSHFEKKIDDDLSLIIKPYSNFVSFGYNRQICNGLTFQFNFYNKPKFALNKTSNTIFFE